ncbi:BTAD domain-containing putative transcriptional regulator [Kitasatospora sp. NPDC057223]|uniref:AfsR/SARP family transcriptional regulator n=1 Tax=Kitasatospora sp. NPDC057223 TaxID=3346055 RepID=UPI00362FF8E9
MGPLEIIGPRGPAGITAPRQRIVLTALLLKSNRTVPVEMLIDAVWGENPPATARSQIHICVSNLRKRLARAGVFTLIDTQPLGYRALVDGDELDLHRFDRLVADGRALVARGDLAAAAECLAAALRLWREPAPVSGDHDWVQSMAGHIWDWRASVAEEYFDLRITLGQATSILRDLTGLVVEYPFRERLRAQLMISLYRAGRQVDALAEYRDLHDLFARELSLRPGLELRRLQQDILSGAAEHLAPTGSVAGADNPAGRYVAIGGFA